MMVVDFVRSILIVDYIQRNERGGGVRGKIWRGAEYNHAASAYSTISGCHDHVHHNLQHHPKYLRNKVERLYVYNTTKLFMWFCICYFIGMLVVCFHSDYLNGGVKFFYLDQQSSDHYILKVLNRMKENGSIYWCSLEAFINLYAYDVLPCLYSSAISSRCSSASTSSVSSRATTAISWRVYSATPRPSVSSSSCWWPIWCPSCRPSLLSTSSIMRATGTALWDSSTQWRSTSSEGWRCYFSTGDSMPTQAIPGWAMWCTWTCTCARWWCWWCTR